MISKCDLPPHSFHSFPPLLSSQDMNVILPRHSSNPPSSGSLHGDRKPPSSAKAARTPPRTALATPCVCKAAGADAALSKAPLILALAVLGAFVAGTGGGALIALALVAACTKEGAEAMSTVDGTSMWCVYLFEPPRLACAHASCCVASRKRFVFLSS